MDATGFQVFKSSSVVSFLFVRLFLLFIIPLVASIFCNKAYLKLTWGKTVLISVCSLLIACTIVIWKIWQYESEHQIPSDRIIFINIIPSGILVLFLIPLIVQLYRKWLGGGATEEEKTPGWEGFKAWLSPGNLICCTGIVICGWMMCYPHNNWDKVFGLSIMTFPVLWIYPLINTMNFYITQLGTGKENISMAQAKILKMLEDGKINTQECAELLGALNEPPRAQPETGESSPPPQPEPDVSEKTV